MYFSSRATLAGLLLAGVAHAALPAVPLHVEGRFIVDSAGKRVKLGCANWYGADQNDYVVGGLYLQTLATIAKEIADAGFNCVRLPFSVEMVLTNPAISARAVTAEPLLQGKNAIDGYDAAISALLSAGVMVIVDAHMLDSGWCCSTSDENGLWYNDRWTAAQWQTALVAVATRYRNQSAVIGIDLKNELRQATVGGKTISPTWGSGNSASDWALAATNAANAVLSAASHWLVIVEGLNYATDLTGVKSHPITVNKQSQLVYEAHNYVFDNNFSETYEHFASGLDAAWGFIINQTSAAPVWVGEIGTCNGDTTSCVDGPKGLGLWWQYLMRYLALNSLDFGYWAIDGTQSTAPGRTWNATETYGILNTDWSAPASLPLLQSLQALMT